MSKPIKLKHPTASSFSVAGRSYVPGKGGVFEMPPGDAAVAIELGFCPVVTAKKDGAAEAADDAEGTPEA